MSEITALSISPMNWPTDQLLTALGVVNAIGASDPVITPSLVQRIVTDSRIAGPGDVFVALRGEHFDAHDFIAQVAAQGALMAIVTKLTNAPIKQVLVPDTLIALGALAKAWRQQFSLPVIAVTGSNGKTTTKEMIACIVRQQFCDDHVLVTQGNLNNQIGVPHTLLNLRAHHRIAVIELGMNHPGEIDALARITQPTVALVNNAQREHQEFMHSVEAVAIENGSVFAHLHNAGNTEGFTEGNTGIAVFPCDDEFTPQWHTLAGTARTITFGLAQSGLTQATQMPNLTVIGQPLPEGQQITLSGLFGTLTVTLRALGQHNLLNAAAAAACASAAGCSSEAIADGLVRFMPVKGRMQPLPFAPFGISQSCLINDTYNANPDSVKAAIDVLSAYPQQRVLVLGDMGEVGNQGPEFHQEVGAYAASKGIDILLALGELSQFTVRAFNDASVAPRQNGAHYATLAALIDALLATLVNQSNQPRVAILVKGSRFMKMERVIEALSTLTPASNNHGGENAT